MSIFFVQFLLIESSFLLEIMSQSNERSATTVDMDFFEQPAYLLNKRLLSIIGIWPFQKTVPKLLRQNIVLIFCFSLLIAEVKGKKKKKKMFIFYNNNKINAKIEAYNDTILFE